MYHVYRMDSTDRPCSHMADLNDFTQLVEWLKGQPTNHAGTYFVTASNGSIVGMEVPGSKRWCLIG